MNNKNQNDTSKRVTRENSISSIKIRLAQSDDDVLNITTLGQMATAETRLFQKFPYQYDAKKRQAFWLEKIQKHPNQYGMLMAEQGDHLVGMVAMQIGAHFHLAMPNVQILSLYVHPDNRSGSAAIKLLHACRRWSLDKGATLINFHVTSGARMDTTDKLVRRLGFEQLGGNYELILDENKIQEIAAASFEGSV